MEIVTQNLDTPVRPATSRLNFLDAIRGYAIIAITLNHVGNLTTRLGREGTDLLTLTQIGYSSAAELFVAVSGMLFGIVYLRGRKPIVRSSINRLSKIYIYNMFLFTMIVAVTQLFPQISEATGIAINGRFDNSLFISTVFLKQAPYLVGVLFLYVYLIIIFVLIVSLFKSNRTRMLASTAIYCAGWALQYFGLGYGSGIGFDILTWQLIFVLPALWGSTYSKSSFSENFARPYAVFIGCLIFLFISSCFKAAEVIGIFSFSRNMPILFDKDVLGIFRIVHSLVTFVALGLAFEWLERRYAFIFNIFRAAGSVSLEAYCCSALVTYFCAGLWITLGSGKISYMLLAVAGAVFTTLFAIALSKFRSSGKMRASQ